MPTAIAPLVAAFKRRLANAPGPARASGEASNGEPVMVELFLGGQWVDITSYTLVRDDSGQISISNKGIRSEGAQTDPAAADLQLLNTDGRFNPRVPTGPYYGLIGRNTPLRWSVPDGNGGKNYRIWGEVSWAQGWEKSGNDIWTDVSVAGILQRLAQGPVPERSVVYNAVTSPLAPSVVAYWPCEDASDAIQIASAVASGSPMSFTSGTPDLASSTVFPASDPLPTFTGAVATGGVAKYSSTTAIQVRCFFYAPAVSLSDRKVIFRVVQEDNIVVSTRGQWEVIYDATTHSLSVVLLGADGTYFTEIPLSMDVRNKPLYISLEFQESGSDTIYTIRALDVLTGTTDSASITATEGLNRVTSVSLFPASVAAAGGNATSGLAGGVIGHITVENAISAITALGPRLNPVGETAGRRIQRLCAEAGIPFDWVGGLDDTVAMGGQGKQNVISLIQECVLADGGMLYEAMNTGGLGYRTRPSLYNQDPTLVLSYPGNNLAQVPIPTSDDRYLANKVVVTVGGVSASYEETEGRLSTAPPPAGVGAYGPNTDSGLALNLAATDTGTLRDQAAWRVHLGTVDEDRQPQISVNLAHASFVHDPALKRAVLALRQGDRIQITDPPDWMPPDTIDQLVLGMEETLTHFEHRITFYCAPASPYTVGYLDMNLARVDTDGSELRAAITSNDTEMDVVPPAGHSTLWTTSAVDWPFDVRVGGEVMTVTGVTGWLEDVFGRSVSNGWGTSDTGQAWSTGGGTAADYAVGSGVGSHTLATVNASRRTFVDTDIVNFDYYVDVAVSATATGGSLFGGPTGRYMDSSNLYQARLEFTTGSALILSIRKLVNSNETQLGTYTLVDTYTPGGFVRIRFQASGATFRAKAWLATDPVEEPNWHVTVTDTSITTAAFMGTRSISSSANTNVNPAVRYDNLRVANPQTLTVTRSVNGVVKAQTAGADVRLATPTILAL